MAPALLQLLAEGHTPATSCVNLAEVERGLRSRERRRGEALNGRLRFLATDQSNWSRGGRTIHTADALVAGTARSHGAVLGTHNLADLPMRDLRVESLAEGSARG